MLLLLVGMIFAIGLASATGWMVYRGLKHRSMRQELSEPRLIEITKCGDQILEVILRYKRDNGQLPTKLNDLELSSCSDCLSFTDEYGSWEVLPPDQSGQVGLRLTMHESWRSATAWSHISVGLTPEGGGEWCAVRETPYSVFPNDIHHLRNASPRRNEQ